MSGTSRRLSVATSRPNSEIKPRVGLSARNRSLSSDDLPAPDAPVRKVNDPWASSKETSRRISGPRPYLSPTLSRRITSYPFPEAIDRPLNSDLTTTVASCSDEPSKFRLKRQPASESPPSEGRFGDDSDLSVLRNSQRAADARPSPAGALPRLRRELARDGPPRCHRCRCRPRAAAGCGGRGSRDRGGCPRHRARRPPGGRTPCRCHAAPPCRAPRL